MPIDAVPSRSVTMPEAVLVALTRLQPSTAAPGARSAYSTMPRPCSAKSNDRLSKSNSNSG